ncbi:HlyD family secretion protein, partial [Ectothiorhodospiraceae bacterium WFHF3C12]|nr:HlyD family secretion protein [Ectothiorhodospiraceae bacterium WFHF3C12]
AARDVRTTQRDRARQELDRVEPMARKGLASDQEQDDARHAVAEAVEQLKQAEAERAEAQAALAEARVAVREPEVLRRQQAVVSARLAEARAEVALQEVNLADRVVRSPIDGVVDKVFVEAGEYVDASRYLIMVHEPGRVWVEARIKETRLAPIAVGQPVNVSVDAYPDRVYQGRVKRVVRAATSQFALLPDPNPSGNFTKITQRLPVRIALDDPDERLAPGMMVEVAIHVGG